MDANSVMVLFEHLQQCMLLWGPAIEVLDEVHQLNPVSPLETLEKSTALEDPWNSLTNTVK